MLISAGRDRAKAVSAQLASNLLGFLDWLVP